MFGDQAVWIISLIGKSLVSTSLLRGVKTIAFEHDYACWYLNSKQFAWDSRTPIVVGRIAEIMPRIAADQYQIMLTADFIVRSIFTRWRSVASKAWVKFQHTRLDVKSVGWSLFCYCLDRSPPASLNLKFEFGSLSQFLCNIRSILSSVYMSHRVYHQPNVRFDKRIATSEIENNLQNVGTSRTVNSSWPCWSSNSVFFIRNTWVATTDGLSLDPKVGRLMIFWAACKYF